MSRSPTAAGAIAGAIIGLICLRSVIFEYGSYLRWHVVLAGAAQGALFAAAAVVSARLARNRNIALRLAIAACAGWIGGYVGMWPVIMSVDEAWPAFQWAEHWWDPYRAGGSAVTLLCLWLTFGAARSRMFLHVAAATIAGAAGYLLFWEAILGGSLADPDLISLALIHGGIWGVLVGIAVSNAQRSGARSARAEPTAASVSVPRAAA